MTTLYIAPRAWRQIEQAVKKNPSVETGGVLMGYPLNATDWLVTYASEPGPKAVHTAKQINFDDTYLQKLVSQMRLRSFRRWQYIGDWHSHTVSRLLPSKMDKATISKKTASAAYGSKSPIMLIVGLNRHAQVEARGYIMAGSLRAIPKIELAMRRAR